VLVLVLKLVLVVLIQLLPLGSMPLPLRQTRGAEPAPGLVLDHLVGDPRLVAQLVPPVVAPVAEDHLVVGRAVHAAALLAERRLLGRALAVVWVMVVVVVVMVLLRACPLAGCVHGRGVVRGWLEDLAA
jgi:hypothetical protein